MEEAQPGHAADAPLLRDIIESYHPGLATLAMIPSTSGIPGACASFSWRCQAIRLGRGGIGFLAATVLTFGTPGQKSSKTQQPGTIRRAFFLGGIQ